MDYTYVALAAALLLTAFWTLASADSVKGALSLSAIGGACAYDAVPHDLPRGIVSGGTFALVIVAWIVGTIVVIWRQRRRSADLT